MIVGPGVGARRPVGRRVAHRRYRLRDAHVRDRALRARPQDGRRRRSRSSCRLPRAARICRKRALSPDGGATLLHRAHAPGDHYVYLNTALGNFVIASRTCSTANRHLISGFGSATTPQVVARRQVGRVHSPRRREDRAVQLRRRRAHAARRCTRSSIATCRATTSRRSTTTRRSTGSLTIATSRSGARAQLLRRHAERRRRSRFRSASTATASHPCRAVRTRLDAAPERVDVEDHPAARASRRDGNEIVFRALGKLWRQDVAGQRAPQRLTSSQQLRRASRHGRRTVGRSRSSNGTTSAAASLQVRSSSGGRETSSRAAAA